MTEFAEVVYEDGSKSVTSVENRDELFAGLKEHHDRAVSGQAGGPSGIPASRVVKVLFYDEHPVTFNEDNILPSDEVLAAITDYLKAVGPTVNVNEAAAYIRDMSNSITAFEHPHDSQFKMPEKETVTSDAFLNPPENTPKQKGE